MNRSDLELLLAYLDGSLSTEENARIESRIKSEPLLARQLLLLSRDEAILLEWANALVMEPSVTMEPASISASTSQFRFVGARTAWIAVSILLLISGSLFLWQSRNRQERNNERLPIAALPAEPEPTEPELAPQPREARVARLEDVQGEAYIIQQSGEAIPVQSGSELRPGQQLRTGAGGVAVVRLPDSSRMELSTGTLLKILNSGSDIPTEPYHFFMASGAVHAEVENKSIILQTPHATIEASKTSFSSAAGCESTRIELENGSAMMTTMDGESIPLDSGRYVVAAPTKMKGVRPSDLPPRSSTPRYTLIFPSGPVIGVKISPMDGRLAIASWEGPIYLRELQADAFPTILKDHLTHVRAMAFSRDGTLLITGSNDKILRIRDGVTGAEIRTLKKRKLEIDALAISPDCKTLVVSAGSIRNQAELIVYDLESGQELRTLPGHIHKVESIAFDPTGKFLATASRDGKVLLWETSSWEVVRELPGHARGALSVTFSPDGKLIASGGMDGLVNLWNTETSKLEVTLEGSVQEISCLAFSPDSKRLATAGVNGNVWLWDLSPVRAIRSFAGHKFKVTDLCFTSDAKSLITCGWDRSVKVWDID